MSESFSIYSDDIREAMHTYMLSPHLGGRMGTVAGYASSVDAHATESAHERISERSPFMARERVNAAREAARRYRAHYDIGWRPAWPGAALVPWLNGPVAVLP